MTVGVGITCGGDIWEPDQIRAVEELGYDSFWTGEHIIYHRPIMEAVTTLTWAAALTLAHQDRSGDAAAAAPASDPGRERVFLPRRPVRGPRHTHCRRRRRLSPGVRGLRYPDGGARPPGDRSDRDHSQVLDWRALRLRRQDLQAHRRRHAADSGSAGRRADLGIGP